MLNCLIGSPEPLLTCLQNDNTAQCCFHKLLLSRPLEQHGSWLRHIRLRYPLRLPRSDNSFDRPRIPYRLRGERVKPRVRSAQTHPVDRQRCIGRSLCITLDCILECFRYMRSSSRPSKHPNNGQTDDKHDRPTLHACHDRDVGECLSPDPALRCKGRRPGKG